MLGRHATLERGLRDMPGSSSLYGIPENRPAFDLFTPWIYSFDKRHAHFWQDTADSGRNEEMEALSM